MAKTVKAKQEEKIQKPSTEPQVEFQAPNQILPQGSQPPVKEETDAAKEPIATFPPGKTNPPEPKETLQEETPSPMNPSQEESNPGNPPVKTWVPEREGGGGGRGGLLWVVFIVVVGAALIGGGIFVYQKAIKKNGEAPKESESAVPTLPSESEEGFRPVTETPESTPTPEPELERSELKLEVLNGTGEPGAAGKAQALLEGLGYEGVDTGNADSYDYDETVVQIKETGQAVFVLLANDLGDEYTVATQAGTLDEDSQFDAVVIVGE